MEKETKKYPTTEVIRTKQNYYDTLKQNLPYVIKGSLFRKVTIKEKIEYLTQISNAEQSMWEAVYKEYPELLDKNLSLRESEIILIP